MGKYILKRLGYMLVVTLILTLLMYLVYNLIPVNRAENEYKETMKANKAAASWSEYEKEEFKKELYSKYGMDGNIFIRYLRWMGLYPYSGYSRITHENNPTFNGLLQGHVG